MIFAATLVRRCTAGLALASLAGVAAAKLPPLSPEAQAKVAETAAKWFADESDLVLVAFDSNRLGPALRWEPSRGGALFPHLYRTLRLDEVVWDKSLPLGAAGHIFPEGVW